MRHSEIYSERYWVIRLDKGSWGVFDRMLDDVLTTFPTKRSAKSWVDEHQKPCEVPTQVRHLAIYDGSGENPGGQWERHRRALTLQLIQGGAA